MQKVLPMSAKLAAEESSKTGSNPWEPGIDEQDKVQDSQVIDILPITCVNKWLVVMPFAVQANIQLSTGTEHRPVGVIVGTSSQVIDGTDTTSQYQIGTIVLYQKRSALAQLPINQEPYVGKALDIVSEVNVIAIIGRSTHRIVAGALLQQNVAPRY